MEIHGGSQAVDEAFDAPGLDEWVYCQPYESAPDGGDVRYLSLCGGGIVSRLILADISGHGAAVADVALALRDLIRRNINNKKQSRLVADLNRQFAANASTERFATAVVATYLATDGSLTLCNAGHPRPLRRRGNDGRWEYLGPAREEPGNLPWGLDDQSPYQQFGVNFAIDDTVFFFTDALLEATDPTGQPLGEDGLLALAGKIDESNPARVGRALIAAVAGHRGGRDAEDDLTVVAWHRNATGPRHPHLLERLDIYAKVFGLRNY